MPRRSPQRFRKFPASLEAFAQPTDGDGVDGEGGMMHGPRKTAPIIAGGEIKRLPIDLLHLDFQPEENLVPETVEEYALQLQQGGSVLPVRVYFDGEQYWLNDGFHRVAAARKVGILEIDAEVQPGTYADMEAEWKRFLRTLKDDLRRAH